MSGAEPPRPGLAPCGLLTVDVGEPIDIGPTRAGFRRAVPVLGGRMSGDVGSGEILGGWDWQTVHPDGSLSIDATYPVRLDDDRVVTINTVGVRVGSFDSPVVRSSASAGAVPYFRLSVTIDGLGPESAVGVRLLVASGVRAESTVTLAIYQVT